MNKVIETIIKIILVALLFVCIFTFGILNILSKTIFSQEYTLEMLDKSNYYANIYSQIKSDFRNYIYQSGLDENVIDDIITLDEVKADTQRIVSGLYNGLHEEINTDKIAERLNTNIDTSLNGRKIDNKTREQINIFVDQITTQYKETMAKTEYENQIYKYYSKAEKMIDIGKKTSIILAAILGIIIIVTYFRKLFKNVAYVGTAVFATGLAYYIMENYITQKVQIENLTILNDAITLLLREYILSIMEKIATYSYIYLAIGLVLILVGSLVHGLQYHNHSHKKA